VFERRRRFNDVSVLIQRLDLNLSSEKELSREEHQHQLRLEKALVTPVRVPRVGDQPVLLTSFNTKADNLHDMLAYIYTGTTRDQWFTHSTEVDVP
jgi:hypothetical protein